MDTALKYPWQQTIVDAFLELAPERLPQKLEAAERAIRERLYTPQQPDERERLALNDALHLLHVIFPDWRAVNSQTSPVSRTSANSPRLGP